MNVLHDIHTETGKSLPVKQIYSDLISISEFCFRDWIVMKHCEMGLSSWLTRNSQFAVLPLWVKYSILLLKLSSICYT